MNNGVIRKMVKSDSYTPRQIVELLDRYIVGQANAKKSVAIALRNRYRRNLLSAELRDEIAPKNILMIGPTSRIVAMSFCEPRSCRLQLSS